MLPQSRTLQRRTRGTLAHRFEAEVLREVLRRVKADTVVGDFQRDTSRVALEFQIRLARTGVLDGVCRASRAMR